MPKIVIAAPCQLIHRFLLPPHAPHTINHSFVGGALILVKVLASLLEASYSTARLGGTGLKAKNNKQLNDKWLQKNQYGLGLPERFIRMEPYSPPPSWLGFLNPKTKFLRVLDKEDSKDFDLPVGFSFDLSSSSVVRNVIVVGGNPQKVGGFLKTKLTNNKNFVIKDEDFFYVKAKDPNSIIKHCKSIKDLCEGNSKTIIGQIDLSDLAKDYPIHTDTSYERTVGDICRASKHKGKNREFMLDSLVGEGTLNHLIIRIGNAACILVSRKNNQHDGDEENNQKWDLRLLFHPKRSAPTTFPGLGIMLAYDLILTASVVNQLAKLDTSTRLINDALATGIKHGIQGTYRCFCEGFGIFRGDGDPEKNYDSTAKVPGDERFAQYIRHGIWVEDEPGPVPDPQGCASRIILTEGKDLHPEEYVVEQAPEKVIDLPVDYQKANSPNVFWRTVLGEKLGTDPAQCLIIAQKYLKGESNDNAPLPIVEIGKLKIVDRHEVEDYLFLQRLLLSYNGNHDLKRPMCIGVFGQPGAGKSFGVKQLVAEMTSGNPSSTDKEITINLSQMRSLGELTESFHLVRDACLRSPNPLVFFDEFDSGFEGKAFGWLKYFLAPMQDGEFVENGKTYHFGKAIFVFAGGVNHSFSEFNERSRNPDFCDAKGPDFISRLRGILNIKGMNRPEGDEIEHIYMIRRAVFLKDKLKERLGKIPKNIDPTLVKAFLTIPRYKHGVRSLEAILDMSSLQRGQKFTHSNLPPRDQLDMHVDSRDFLRRAGVSVPHDK